MLQLSKMLENFWKTNFQGSEAATSGGEKAYFLGSSQLGSSSGRGHGSFLGCGCLRSRGVSQGLSRSDVECYECGGHGHMKCECAMFLKKQDQKELKERHLGKSAQDSDHHHCFTALPVNWPHSGSVLIDLGASKHMTGEQNFLSNCRVLDPAEPVDIANGSTIDAVEIGTLIVDT